MNLPSIGVEQNNIDVLFSPKTFKETLINHISTAKNRIYITALYLQNDEAGKEVLTALYLAKTKNPKLQVNVFVDAHRAQRGLIGQKDQAGNQAMYKAFAKEWPVKVNVYGVAVKSRELMGVLHLKGIVIDDVVLYSGASINNIYLHQQQKYRLDRYYIIRSDELAHSFCEYLQSTFVDNNIAIQLNSGHLPTKKEQKRKSNKTKSIARHAKYRINNVEQHKSIQVTPLVGCGKRDNQLNSSICQLLAESRQSIVIFTPYFNLPKQLTKALISALKRGINITIIVGDKTANDFYISPERPFSTIGIVPYLYEQILRKFAKRWQSYIDKGLLTLKLWRDEDNSFHLKGLVVDECYHLITGSNLNPRAWHLDLENGLLIQDTKKHLFEKFTQELQHICRNTTVIERYQEIDAVAQYPEKPRKLLSRLSYSNIDRVLKRFM